MKTIKISQAIQNLCREFAEKCVSTNADEYARRGQRNLALIKQQIYEGKLAEFGVYEHIVTDFNYKPASTPDLSIYSSSKKSFDADLVLNYGYACEFIHIKSQNKTSALRYGDSWLFQKNDPVVRNANKNDICVFCRVSGDEVEIVLKKPALELIFKEPKLSKLKGNKVAVYLEDYGGKDVEDKNEI